MIERKILQIGDTPLSISVYSVESAPTRMNDPGMIEIILCLAGSVRFGYAYEDFNLKAGDYIAVDRDAYYLYEGKDNVCVSFYLDLMRYKERYPHINHALFVCEGTPETDTIGYPTRAHKQIKGLMITALEGLLQNRDIDMFRNIADRMTDLMINNFDISFYHYGSQDMPQKALERNRTIQEYIYEHRQKNRVVKHRPSLGNHEELPFGVYEE